MRSYFLGTKTSFRLKPLLLLPIIFLGSGFRARSGPFFFL